MVADSTVVYNGVTVKKKIIPDSTRWIDDNKAIKAGFEPGAKYKACVKMEKVNMSLIKSRCLHNLNLKIYNINFM